MLFAWPCQAGITTADRLVTVSAGYADEIKTYLGGWGMEVRGRGAAAHLRACAWLPGVIRWVSASL
jgi:hypothetical protein